MSTTSDKALPPGVFLAKKKDGSIYYRASITYKNKHISLGSYDNAKDAHRAYVEAGTVLSDASVTIESAKDTDALLFEKRVILCNFRDNGVYIPNPIYVRPKMFYYYFSPDDFFVFSIEDLFYYSAHKIQRRGGHFFVADYGSQINILSRYGIRSHAVAGRDYVFVNGNPQDLQYSNIEVINSYYGVHKEGDGKFSAKIHINGYIKLGTFSSVPEAAIAYNKAVDVCTDMGLERSYPANYMDEISPKAYADIYTSIRLPKSLNTAVRKALDQTGSS